MTMGTRLACMGGGASSRLSSIVPGLLFMGNAFRRCRRHDSCSSNQPRKGAITHQLRTQRGSRLGTLVETAYALDHLPLARRNRFDLDIELVVAHHDRIARGERVEQELAPHLTLGARPELLAQARERRLALGALGQPEIEALQERLDPALDER